MGVDRLKALVPFAAIQQPHADVVLHLIEFLTDYVQLIRFQVDNQIPASKHAISL
jgi:hypothetical protein